MTWEIITAVLLTIFVVGNIRVWKTEKIRLRCIDMAITNRMLGRAYIHAEKNDVIVERAAVFEDYVRKGRAKPKNPPPPPPPPPPPRIDRLSEGNV